MLGLLIRLAALVICALSLGPSFAHALEAPPRLRNWPPELWRETTVFHGQYALFGAVGGPIEVLGVLLAAGVAWLSFRDAQGFAPALVAAILFAAALAVWLAVVKSGQRRHGDVAPRPAAGRFHCRAASLGDGACGDGGALAGWFRRARLVGSGLEWSGPDLTSC
jgi:hypothetical protein